MELKVGKQVRVRSDLKSGKYYSGLFMNPDMVQYCGKVFTITSILSPNKCEISTDKNWTWNDEMLEEVNKPLTMKDMKIGLKVIALTKTCGISEDESSAFQLCKKYGHLFVCHIYDDHVACALDTNSGGDNFFPSDLILFDDSYLPEQPNYITLDDKIQINDLVLIKVSSSFAKKGEIGLAVGFDGNNVMVGFNHKLPSSSGNWNSRFPAKQNHGYCIDKSHVSRICMNNSDRIKSNLPTSVDDFL